jgi:hypothetical protein
MTLPIGFICDNTTLERYIRLRQINTYLPVEIVLFNLGDIISQPLFTTINQVEDAVRELNSKGINNFILNFSSNLIVNWALGIGLNKNEGIYCDKIERWANSTFFCQNNTLAYEGNNSNLLLVVSNLYRFTDVQSGKDNADVIDIFTKEIYVNVPLPKKIYNIIEAGDNASINLSNLLVEAGKTLGFEVVDIPVRLIQDPDPAKQAIFGGLYEFINGSEQILNSWISILNTTTETTGLSVAVNGNFNNAFTNTLLNTNLKLLNVDNGLQVNATLYEALNDTTQPISIYGGNPLVLSSRTIRNKFLASNYSYQPLSDTNVISLTPLQIEQFRTFYNTRNIFNPILTKVAGFLPGDNGLNIPLVNIEIVEYIYSKAQGLINSFNGAQDNRFRFDLRTQRSRISALLAYFIIPANSFESIEKGLRPNKNFEP